MANNPLLDIKGVHLSFAGNRVLNNVTVAIEAESIASIIGPNGAGKTSLFNSITGFYKPQSGQIDFTGTRLLGKKPHIVAALGVARTFQNVRLFKQLSVLENVMSGMHCRTSSNAIDAIFRTRRHKNEEKMIREVASDCLKFVELTDSANTITKHLPYGHQRLVEIARALASQPKLLLLDEPAAGLNGAEKKFLVNLIKKIRSDLKIAVLLIEHDMDLVMNVSEHIAVLDHGVVIAKGNAQEIRANPAVIEAYIGQEDEEMVEA